MAKTDFDVLILGAGLTGIGMACHLTRNAPGKTYAVLERREAIGGTWDLFRYPGVRSDSDMYTLGYSFRPWHGSKVLADGASIRQYVVDTADEFGVTPNIRFGRKVVSAEFCSRDSRWTVTTIVEATGKRERYTAQFLVGATGFYNYDAGYRPTFPGEDLFAGQIVHPQHWPEDLDYDGKKVVVIGSGATAITLVPAMAGVAEHVTMLQRSPTYVVAVPSRDPLTALMQAVGVPARAIYRLGRARNIAVQRSSYDLSKLSPGLVRRAIRGAARLQLGRGFDMGHFSPHYNPWDERLCVVPDGDLFRSLRAGAASVATDRIASFTATGIRLVSGQHLDADIIVTATGLDLQMLGGAELVVDGTQVDISDRVFYNGLMLDGVPNATLVLGYTNASWTLKVDLVGEYFCRLLHHMERNGYQQVTAVAGQGDRTDQLGVGSNLQSGYIQRASADLPRQGTRSPWRSLSHYYRDALALRLRRLDDPVLAFESALSARPSGSPRRVGSSRR